MIHATEIHTSDLTADCMKYVQLRLAGKRIGETASAKFRGSVWHEARALCYASGKWDDAATFQALTAANTIAREQAARDREPLTEAVDRNWPTMLAELQPMLIRYGAVVASRVGKLIGCELPIRMTLAVDGEPVEFASHIDVLFRDQFGNLRMDDDKSQEQSPSRAFLARNMQFAMYGLAIRHGEVMVDGEWVAFNQWPMMAWIHVNNLKPFGRKTTVSEVDWATGAVEQVEYVKGDMRPVERIVVPVPIDESRTAAIQDEFATRVRMARAGLWPTNPDETGCMLCDAQRHCPSFQSQGDAW